MELNKEKYLYKFLKYDFQDNQFEIMFLTDILKEKYDDLINDYIYQVFGLLYLSKENIWLFGKNQIDRKSSFDTSEEIKLDKKYYKKMFDALFKG